MSHQPDNFFAGTQVVSLVEVRGTNSSLVLSQFKKTAQDLRNSGEIKRKHAMHLLRLLLTGAATLRQGRVTVRVEAHRDRLLAVKRGEIPWSEVDNWRKELHRDFERALTETKLPERPNYEAANWFLIKARRETAGNQNNDGGCSTRRLADST